MTHRNNSPTHPLVSMVVPVFNAGPYLDQALRSLREQSYGNLEIICLNDGSTDDSLAIMEQHAAEDVRIRVIDKANEGYGATCNRGIAEAQGEWLGILEPDDWLLPEAIEKMVNTAETAAAATGQEDGRAGAARKPGDANANANANANAHDDPANTSDSSPLGHRSIGFPDIVKTPYWRVLFADTPEQTLVHCYYKGTPAPAGAKRLSGGWLVEGKPAIAECTQLMEYHPSIWSALYRTNFLRENDIQFLPIPGAGWADNPFLVETMCAVRSIAYLDEPFYCYREETPAHFEATVRNQPALVFDRWNDGADVLERYPNLDHRVVQAHYHRGFNNRDKAAAILGEDNPLVQQETARMFARMDAQLVLGDSNLPLSQRSLFGEQTHQSFSFSFKDRLNQWTRNAFSTLRHIATIGLSGSLAIARLNKQSK